HRRLRREPPPPRAGGAGASADRADPAPESGESGGESGGGATGRRATRTVRGARRVVTAGTPAHRAGSNGRGCGTGLELHATGASLTPVRREACGWSSVARGLAGACARGDARDAGGATAAAL